MDEVEQQELECASRFSEIHQGGTDWEDSVNKYNALCHELKSQFKQEPPMFRLDK